MNVDLIPVLERAKPDASSWAVRAAFRRLVYITDQELITWVNEHTRGFRASEFDRDQACALPGGYVMVVNQQPIFYPQCCGDLSDIYYWEKIAHGEDAYCEGHPSPQLNFTADSIKFDFSTEDTDEQFRPMPQLTTITIGKASLLYAVERCVSDLAVFCRRLEQINRAEGLGINDIGELLVWNLGNHA